MLKAIVVTVIFYAVLSAILFGAAGTFDVPAFWAYISELVILSAVTLPLVQKHSPGLIEERMRPGAGEQDTIFIRAAIVLSIAHYALAGLDVGRFCWSSSVPLGLQVIAFAIIAAGVSVMTWAMVVNPFFSSAVRIQEDRGQVVITSGPYQYVRHPGYAGGIPYLAFSGIALGSWVSVAPMVVVVALVFRRIAVEERMLRDNLPGYTEYAERVRYRLVPGVW